MKKRKTMLLSQNQNSQENLDSGKNESLEKENKKDEQQILMDSLNFKKFRTYMPLPIDESGNFYRICVLMSMIGFCS